MKNVVLIGCVAEKQAGIHKAKDLYVSDLFKKSFAYAEALNCPIWILSAKHCLLDINKEIESYDKSMKDLDKEEKEEWKTNVINALKENYDFDDTSFIILAGQDYYELLLDELKHVELPLKGLQLGKRLKKLNELIESIGK